MTYSEFHALIAEALTATDSETFRSAHPELSVSDLTSIHHLAHISVREMAAEAGLSQTALARRFGIPLRTVQRWCAGDPVPMHVKLMIAECLGLIDVERS